MKTCVTMFGTPWPDQADKLTWELRVNWCWWGVALNWGGTSRIKYNLSQQPPAKTEVLQHYVGLNIGPVFLTVRWPRQ